ncbi:hypothetical protein BS614_23995 [Paenibacillus xylanexedens]|nr:hypothetical protein BS614_23995 [Paenibacillus xylanexedens]
MNHTYKVLTTNMEFLAAALTRVCVSVWQLQEDRERLIDYGWKIFPTALRIQSTKIEQEG